MTAGEETPLTTLTPGAAFVRGLRDVFPVVVGYFSASIAFGLIARSLGISLAITQAFSLITFTGAAQFMALNLIAAGATGPQIVLSYFLINLRYLLMSASVARKIAFDRFGQRFLLAFGVTDENFGITTSWAGAVPPAYQGALELGPWLGWNIGTLTGWLFGSVIPPSLSAAMGASLYALFMALLLPDLRRGLPWILTVAAAAGINSVLTLLTPIGPGWSFVISMIAATILGMAIIPDEPEKSS